MREIPDDIGDFDQGSKTEDGGIDTHQEGFLSSE